MSYLPRMSKTYKEPPQPPEEFQPEPTTCPFPAASSLLDERTHNPSMVLKQYKYLPHPLPVLPGPSVADEANEHELYREASKYRRSSTKFESTVKFSHVNLPSPDDSKASLEESKLSLKGQKSKISLRKPSPSKKSIKGSKTWVGKKKSKGTLDKKKFSSKDVSIQMYLIEESVSKSFLAAQEERQHKNWEDSLSSDEVSSKNEASIVSFLRSEGLRKKTSFEDPPLKQLVHRSVQCTLFGSSEKVFVIPSAIKFLLRALAFLLHELNREEVVSCNMGEPKRLMTQIQLILGDLCHQTTVKEFGFDVTYSDSKRVEKILTDIRKYVKDLYGDKEEYVHTMEDLKRVFVDLKKKEMELDILNDKLKDMEDNQENEVEMKESYFKHPDVTLQNKRLENEQLTAEKEFSSRDLKKYQTTLAEIDWDIKSFQEQFASLKKSSVTKSKTDILGRKASVQKISNDVSVRGSKSKESEKNQ